MTVLGVHIIQKQCVKRDVGLTSRINMIGLNGNEGTHYLVERIARAITGELQDYPMMGKNAGKKRWELHIDQALRVLDLLEKEGMV